MALALTPLLRRNFEPGLNLTRRRANSVPHDFRGAPEEGEVCVSIRSTILLPFGEEVSFWRPRQYWIARGYGRSCCVAEPYGRGLKSAARTAMLLGPFGCQYHFGNVSQGETRRLDGAIFKAAEIGSAAKQFPCQRCMEKSHQSNASGTATTRNTAITTNNKNNQSRQV